MEGESFAQWAVRIFAGKVVDRHWYNRNKHIFPASRWETYDPDKVFELYTTHGSEVKIWNGIM